MKALEQVGDARASPCADLPLCGFAFVRICLCAAPQPMRRMDRLFCNRLFSRRLFSSPPADQATKKRLRQPKAIGGAQNTKEHTKEWRCRESNPSLHGRTRRTSTCIVALLACRSRRRPSHQAQRKPRLIAGVASIHPATPNRSASELRPSDRCLRQPEDRGHKRQMGRYAAIAYE